MRFGPGFFSLSFGLERQMFAFPDLEGNRPGDNYWNGELRRSNEKKLKKLLNLRDSD
jgi:hypothetical protein